MCLPGHRILYDSKSPNVEFLHDLLAVRLSLIAVIHIFWGYKVRFALKICTSYQSLRRTVLFSLNESNITVPGLLCQKALDEDYVDLMDLK